MPIGSNVVGSSLLLPDKEPVPRPPPSPHACDTTIDDVGLVENAPCADVT